MNTIPGLSAYSGALQRLQQSLKTADSDGNGALSLSEFEAAAKTDTSLTNGQPAAATFRKLDADHNGAVSQSEIQQGISVSTQIQSVLLQAQELAAGSAYMQLLGGSSGNNLTSTLLGGSSSLFGNSGDLTSSLLGGASSTSSLTSALTGASSNTATLAGLLGGNNALLQSVLARYTTTGEDS